MTTGHAGQRYAVVVPTVGRPSLAVLLRSLAQQSGPLPEEVVVVDDRPEPQAAVEVPEELMERVPVRVVAGCGRGPGAARNLGWQLTTADWVAFLDDDVVLPGDWADHLATDLAEAAQAPSESGWAAPGVGASQGRIVVPLPRTRRPTDWERSTAGLATARWVTADMAYRRDALVAVHGFDERFPRAYREDADLALRVRTAGWSLRAGTRCTVHPVRATDGGVSLRVQRGNADDALMRRLHGRHWRQLADTGRGRLPWHAAAVALGFLGVVGAGAALAGRYRGDAGHRSRTLGQPAAAVGLGGWLAMFADFALRRIAPGPRDRREVRRMLWTSAVIPPAALAHRALGWWRHRHAAPWPPPTRAVLFDRDGTLVHDVPYNGEPAKVAPVPGARESLDRLRSHGLGVAVVSNQSGVARGLLSWAQVRAVNAEVDRRLGPFGSWQVCPHGLQEGCGCRKPRPGLIRAAARELGVRPEECVVVGDIGADVLAARAAGSRAVLVPTATTRPEEVRTAPLVAVDLPEAVDLILGTVAEPGGRRA